MALHFRPCGLAILSMALFVVSPIAQSQQATESKIAQASNADAHPNTADSLRDVLKDLLLTAKNGDSLGLRSKIAEMEIPDYESWFTRTFGQENGQKFADLYGKSLQPSESHFEMLCTELARQEGGITADRVDAAKKYSTVAGILDEYRANWKKTDDSAGPDSQPVGVFYFVDGKFRLNGSLREVRILSPNKGGPLTPPKAVVPARLINKVPPLYPEAAKKLGIRGEVAVNVIVRTDGTVMVQNVGAGNPLLAPAAVEAVQQWRYAPATVNGEPVLVQVKIYVAFALTTPQAQQK